ncbi:MAG: hypothetical protein II802_03735 [Clostridia bacterium]|nr:hypothetical protein [Clostridia bacterium]
MLKFRLYTFAQVFKITAFVFRYQDVWHQTHGCTISVREVSISKPVTTVEEAAQIMKSAADSLVKKDGNFALKNHFVLAECKSTVDFTNSFW